MTAPALEIDFCTKRKPSLLGLAVFAAGSALLLLAIFLHIGLRDELADVERKLGKIETNSSRPHVVADLSGIDAEYANEVFARLNFSWSDLFVSLEKIGGKDATLLGLHPEGGKRRVVIDGEARDLASVLRYADALEQTSFLSDVQLQQHDIDERNPDRPVRFTLYAGWGK